MNNTGKTKNKKPALIFVAIIVSLVIVALSLYAVLSFFSQNGKPSTSGDVFLYEPDYDAQIMTEEEYLIEDRSVKYSDGIGTWPIYDDDGIYTDDSVQKFLIDYIQKLVSGDAAGLRVMYSEELIAELDIPDRITQQRVYESLFTEISKREAEDNGVIYFTYEFKVEYKIMRNDGTFRSDLASDSIKGQYFTIEHRGTDIRITQVVEYAIKGGR